MRAFVSQRITPKPMIAMIAHAFRKVTQFLMLAVRDSSRFPACFDSQVDISIRKLRALLIRHSKVFLHSQLCGYVDWFNWLNGITQLRTFRYLMLFLFDQVSDLGQAFWGMQLDFSSLLFCLLQFLSRNLLRLYRDGFAKFRIVLILPQERCQHILRRGGTERRKVRRAEFWLFEGSGLSVVLDDWGPLHQS